MSAEVYSSMGHFEEDRFRERCTAKRNSATNWAQIRNARSLQTSPRALGKFMRMEHEQSVRITSA